MNLEKTALLIIDVQEVLDDPAMGTLNNPEAEANILHLLKHWRAHKLPLFFVKYLSPRKASPFHPGSPGTAIKASVAPLPGESLVAKHFESAFMKTGLEEKLRKEGIQALIFVGFYTDQCVAASSKVANNLGFRVHVVADATGTIGCTGHGGRFFTADETHALALGGLERDGITIIKTGELLTRVHGQNAP